MTERPHDAFHKAFEILIGHEGGYANDSQDPGGETQFGISKRSYPNLNIRALTLEDARRIYKRDFWDKCRCDEFPASISLLLFDAAVNCGPGRSVKWLQKAVGATPDGAIGPATMGAVQKAVAVKGEAAVCRDVLVTRVMHHVSLPTWGRFGLGWARRIMSLPFAAVQIAAVTETRNGS